MTNKIKSIKNIINVPDIVMKEEASSRMSKLVEDSTTTTEA